VLPIVLHTGQQPWDANRSLADLFDVPEVLRAWLPTWGMPLWDLPEHSPEELLRTGESLWQALAVPRAAGAPTDDFQRVLEEALRRLEPLGTTRPVHWHQMLRFVLYWALYRRPRPEHARLLAAARESQTNVHLGQEVETMSQQMFKTFEEELLEKGEARGEARGELRAYRTLLQNQLQQKFQQLPEELLQRIATADLDRLKAASLQVLAIQSLAELQL
jgi:hypothetical protein